MAEGAATAVVVGVVAGGAAAVEEVVVVEVRPLMGLYCAAPLPQLIMVVFEELIPC